MPTYEYRCKDCGDELEVVQSFTDDPLDTCPSCGGDLRKKFAAPGISFRGSGFYKTDSRGSSSSTTAAGSSDGSESKSSNGSSDSSSGGTKESSTSKPSDASSGSSGSAGSSTSGSKTATPA